MEQWTEQTSLRLLELIASAPTSRCGDGEMALRLDAQAEEHADRKLEKADAATVEVLASLADSDPPFGQWLKTSLERDPRPSTSAAAPRSGTATSVHDREAAWRTGFDWPRIAERWLEWLAAEPIEISRPGSQLPAGPSPSEDLDQGTSSLAQDSPYRRALVAHAQAALRSCALWAQAQKTRQQVGRELAYDMAYGLSHELNNPLANIATRARLLAEEESSERKKQLLSAIVDQAMRGCEMIADLMWIARPPLLARQLVDLGSVVRETIAKARPWAEARGLNLTLDCPEEPMPIATDRLAIAEAVWAVLRNALEVARGEVAVTVVAACSAEESLVQRPHGQSPYGVQPAVRLCILDDGPGIGPHALLHAFNPFFSGREAGRGLGVGLAKADRIVASGGGSVSLANRPEGGCAATISLPLCADEHLPG